MDNNIDVLDELNKGCCMGRDSLSMILDKEKDGRFYSLLLNQKKSYEDLSCEISDLYHEYSSSEIHKTNLMEKMMLWYGIEKDTILDDSISKLADMLIRGTTMGVIEGVRIINNKTMDKKVHKLCSKYIKMQEDYIEKLKEYL